MMTLFIGIFLISQILRATMQGYFLPASIAGIVGYFSKDLISHEVLYDFALALPAVIPAISLGS